MSSLIEDRAQRHVRFSKRRPTLFTYAADLSACFGVDTTVVIFSESGSAFAFSSPSVDAALDLGDLAARRRELKEAEALVAAEKERMKAIGVKVKLAVAEAGRAGWWEADAGALGEAELPEFERALRKLRDAVQCLVNKKAAPPAADAPA